MEVDKSHSIKDTELVQNNFAIKLERYILNKVDKTILRPGTEDLYSKLYNIDPSKIISIPHKTIFDQFERKLQPPDPKKGAKLDSRSKNSLKRANFVSKW